MLAATVNVNGRYRRRASVTEPVADVPPDSLDIIANHLESIVASTRATVVLVLVWMPDVRCNAARCSVISVIDLSGRASAPLRSKNRASR